jgi:transcriptional regulator with XRE-family HTH domain
MASKDVAVKESFGEALRRWRTAEKMPQPELARRVFVSQSFISKVENGAEQPSSEFARACDEALEANGALAALGPVRRPRNDLRDDVEAWELTDALTSGSLSVKTLEQMRRAVYGYASRYPQATPEQLLGPVHQQLRRLHRALSRPQPSAVRREAARLTGVLAGIAGNLALDLRRQDQADTYFDVAQLAGDDAQDGDLVAWALATRSLVPYFDDRPLDAVLLLDQAAEVAARASSSRRQAWVAALRARSAAAAGDGHAALTHLDTAHACLVKADAPAGNDFFDEARLVGFAGMTMLKLRRANSAAELLSQSVAARAAGDAKGRALATLDQAECMVILGDTTEAGRLVDQAFTIAGSDPVAPIVVRARAVRTDMMAVDPAAATRVTELLREAASRPRPRE